MNIVRNILAIVVGFIVGSIVNLTLINVGPMVIPPPEGADVTTPEGLKEAIKLFTPAHFIFPFLAHALGTLVGAFIAVKIAASHHLKLAMGIGALFTMGGVAVISMVGGPMWFNEVDIMLAYYPMAYLGAVLGGATKPKAEKAVAADNAPQKEATAS